MVVCVVAWLHGLLAGSSGGDTAAVSDRFARLGWNGAGAGSGRAAAAGSVHGGVGCQGRVGLVQVSSVWVRFVSGLEPV